MEYIKIAWNHSGDESPVLLYSEIDDNRFEVRKIYVYRDGRIGYASSNELFGDVELGLVPVPSLDEIAASPSFEILDASQEEFERSWRSRVKTWLL